MSPTVSTLDAFEAAVDAFPAGSSSVVSWCADARAKAERSLRRHGLCLLGEVHGVAENPLIIERLVDELDIEMVALEWPPGLERAIDGLSWLGVRSPRPSRESGAAAPAVAAATAWAGDGRVTAGHFAVLRRLAARAIGVDPPLGAHTAGERDAAMAAQVEDLLRSGSGRALFVAGNAHTRLYPHGDSAPAGARLARDRPGLCAVDIHYARGRFWNLGPRTFAPASPLAGPHLRLAEASEAVVLAAACARTRSATSRVAGSS